MKLIELIGFFRNGGTYSKFCNENSLDAKSEVIEIYAELPLNTESHIRFLPIEESKGANKMKIEGIDCINLFDFFYFQDVISDAKKTPEINDQDLAIKLMDYAIKDA